jgi:hypothetical protein
MKVAMKLKGKYQTNKVVWSPTIIVLHFLEENATYALKLLTKVLIHGNPGRLGRSFVCYDI